VAHRLVSDPEGDGVRSVPAWGPEGTPSEWTDDGTPVFGPDDEPASHEELFDTQYARLLGAARRRGPLKAEELTQIASTYRDALAAGEAPTRAVSARYGVARSTAGRWIAEARRRGQLGKAHPRRAGEVDEGSES
jgi:hypothetical protein